jgi:hypothetical protein
VDEDSASVKVLALSDQCYFQHKKITSKFKGQDWSGFSCYIIGGGPSLKGFDFNRLLGKKTIGINRSFEFYPSDILYFMDFEFYRSICDGGDYSEKVLNKWKNFSGTIVGLSPLSEYLKFGQEVYLVRRGNTPVINYDLDHGIYGGVCSGVGALMLAAQLGATQIFLLGMDLKAKEHIHWHSGYHKQEVETFNLLCRDYIKDFEFVAPVLKARGVSVINCSEDSALTCFPRVGLEAIQ